MNNNQAQQQIPPQAGQRVEQMGVTVQHRSGEMAANAMAAKQKALIEARYVIAYNRPRSILQARSDILAACQRPGFAESARYAKPIGGTTIEGFSIRFAEEAIKAMKNIAVESTTIYEDEEKRTVQITVTDLESNVVYGKEITVAKTVERKNLKQGQQAISERTNSYGQKVFLVEATEDDIANKVASAESKIIRNCGLRLVPSDILEEAEGAIDQTLRKGGGDPQEATKKIVDSFASLNIGAKDLEAYLKHGLNTISPKELTALRAIFTTIKEGSAAWADYLGEGAADPTNKKPDVAGKKPAVAATTVQQQAAAGDAKATAAETKPAAETTTAKSPAKKTEPAASVKAPEPAKPLTVLPPEESEDGDTGPVSETAVAAAPAAETPAATSPAQFAVTEQLAARLVEMGVSPGNFEKWVISGRYADAFKANPIEASAKLIADERALKKLKTIYGTE